LRCSPVFRRSPPARRKSCPPAPVAARPRTNDITEIGWLRLDAGPLPPAVMNLTAPADLPELYRRRYRIKPDLRFLYAFAEVDRLLSGRKKPATLHLGFEGGRWLLRLENEAVGTLPEIPTFADGEELLDQWTRARIARGGLVMVGPPSGDRGLTRTSTVHRPGAAAPGVSMRSAGSAANVGS
jgi:hypothetical protein